MKLQQGETDKPSLFRFGEEAVSFLTERDFKGLATRFGYAMRLGRDPAAAIEADFYSRVSEFNLSPRTFTLPNPTITVKYFEVNDANLYAVVECRLLVSEIYPISADLIVTVNGQESHITLEGIHLA